MTTTTKHSIFDGQEVARICKDTLPGADDKQLISQLCKAYPDHPVRLARTGLEWYRLGGIVNSQGERIATDLMEWIDRTYIECGRDLDALVDHCLENQLIATRLKGTTLYLVANTGDKADDFIQIEIDKIQEVTDRHLVDETQPPEDLEDLIDPLEPLDAEPFSIGPSRYKYRRKTRISSFMDELTRHHPNGHPVRRLMDDWDRSSAAKEHRFCDHWGVRLFQHTGRFGEQVMNIEAVPINDHNLPQLEALSGVRGNSLRTLLTRFDRQAGYPFAWFFYMVKGKLVSPHSGEAVHEDLSGDFDYLPKRDNEVLQSWVRDPYSV